MALPCSAGATSIGISQRLGGSKCSFFRKAGMFIDRTNMLPSFGFDAVEPQLAPPWLPGISIVSVSSGGVKRPLLTAASIFVFHVTRSSEVKIYGSKSAEVNDCTAKGGGLVGNGCVGEVTS